MVAGRERNFERAQPYALPFIQFVHNVETEPVDQTPNPNRNNNRLIGRDRAECPAIEMIEVRVSHEDEIDRRQMMNVKTGLFQSLDHAQPHRPIRINEDVHPTELDEERRMPNPGDANFAGLYFWKKRVGARATSFGKKRGDENLSEKIALVPVGSRTQPDTRRTFCRRTIPRRLANDISPAFL